MRPFSCQRQWQIARYGRATRPVGVLDGGIYCSTKACSASCVCTQAEQEADFGAGILTVDLLPEGGSQAVTDTNKQLYVDLYMQHLLDNSIRPQFDAFRRGFNRVRALFLQAAIVV